MAVALTPQASLLLQAAALTLLFQWTAFVFAAIYRTERYYDLCGSMNFVLVTLFTLFYGGSELSMVQMLANAFVLFWAFRLGCFLFYRVNYLGKDIRFDKVKHRPAVFFLYWTVQAVWVWTTVLPVSIVNTTSHSVDKTYVSIHKLDVLGGVLWIVGFSIESIADHQKLMFRQNAANNDKFMSQGLWTTCRHPNYFGEIMLWWGLYLMCFTNFSGYQHLAVIGPIFVTHLLINVSGVRMSERLQDKKHKNSKSYALYKQRTNVIVPSLSAVGCFLGLTKPAHAAN